MWTYQHLVKWPSGWSHSEICLSLALGRGGGQALEAAASGLSIGACGELGTQQDGGPQLGLQGPRGLGTEMGLLDGAPRGC